MALKRVQKLKQEKSKLEDIKNSLEKENTNLRKKLAFFENPNTPPSARKFPNTKGNGKKRNRKKGDEKKDNSPKKRGAPKGHKGATRPTPEPDEIIEVIAKKCEICGSENIEDLDDPNKRTIEDFPPPQEIKVTQFNLHRIRCADCDQEFISTHPDCPQVGNFGIYLLIYTTMLKFHLRGVLRKIQDYLKYAHDFDISVKGIHDILLRVGDVCKVGYEKNLKKVRNSKWVHIDETGIKINDEKWWLWIFRSAEGDVLVVIRKSRGKKVVEEILGEDWDKPIIVDGWSAYWKYPIVQRCWSHLLRKVDHFIDTSKKAAQLSKEIHNLFDEMKEFLKAERTREEREEQKIDFEKRMKAIVERYDEYDELKVPITYLENGLGKWFTCLLYPGMEPTNNLGEQAMREHVIIRKIIGCFRSERGAKNYQYISSLLASWKLKSKDIFEELEELLRRELCGS